MTQSPSGRLLYCCRLISLQPDRGLILTGELVMAPVSVSSQAEYNEQ
ncbi:hypothetical protein [uncultured Desulfobacter sp.]|nr:hypothetical protein [uncultured Desulfobacter sp.]